jgi:hypothetical protein
MTSLLANIIQQSIGTETSRISVFGEAVHVPSVIQAGGQIPALLQIVVYLQGAQQHRVNVAWPEDIAVRDSVAVEPIGVVGDMEFPLAHQCPRETVRGPMKSPSSSMVCRFSVLGTR